jgi:hypothetical protein
VVERYHLIDFEEAKEGLVRDAKENCRPAGPTQSTGKHLQVPSRWRMRACSRRRGPGPSPMETVCAENIKKYYEPDDDVQTAAKSGF